MSNLDNIIQTILHDAEAEKEGIIKEANEKKDSYIANMKKEAEDIKTETISKANVEAVQLVEKSINNAQLRARDEILDAKQKIVSKVLIIIKDKLKSIDDKTYTDILLNSLKKEKVADSDLIMIQKDRLEAVKSLGLKNSISDKYVDSGFSFIAGNSVLNNDFSSLVDYMQDDLESYIAEKLFVD